MESRPDIAPHASTAPEPLLLRKMHLNLQSQLRRGFFSMLAVGIIVLVFGLLVLALPNLSNDNPLAMLFMLAAFVILAAVVFGPLKQLLHLLFDRVFHYKPARYDRLLAEYTDALSLVSTTDPLNTTLVQLIEGALPVTTYFYFPPPAILQRNKLIAEQAATAFHAADLFTTLALLLDETAHVVEIGQKAQLQPSFKPFANSLEELNAGIIMPLRTTKELVGWVIISRKQSDAPFSYVEKDFLQSIMQVTLEGLDRIRVNQQLADRVAELDGLNQFAQAINFSVSLEDLMSVTAQHSARLVGATNLMVYLRDLASKKAYPVFWKERGKRRSENEGSGHPLKAPHVNEVLEMGRRQYEADDDGRFWLTIPLRAGLEIIGVLQTYTTVPQHERQQHVFQMIATYLGTALERYNYHRELANRAQQMSALNDVIRSLNGATDLDSLLELILEKSMALFGAVAGSFLLVADDTNELTFQAVGGPAGSTLIGSRIPIGTGLAGYVAQVGRPLISNDPQNDPRWFKLNEDPVAFETKAILTVPLLQQKRVLGVLQLINRAETNFYTEEDQHLLMSLANQAVVALERTRLMAQTDAKLRQRLHELSLMQELDRDLNATLNLKSIVDLTLDWALRAVSGSAGSIVLIDDEGEMLAFANYGYRTEFGKDKLSSTGEINGLLGQVLRSGEPHLANDVSRIDGYVNANVATQSQLTLPIIHKQKIIGAVAVESHLLNGFTQDDVVFVARVIDHAATAITNAILYDQVNEANNAKSEFVSLVSHELKIPLTAIKGYTDLLLNGLGGDLSEQQTGFLETVSANSARMSRLITDLTDISRIETGRLHVSPQPIDFSNVVVETMYSITPLSAAKAIDVEIDVPSNLPEINGDHARLVQVLTNLLSNACKYSAEGTAVQLQARLENGARWPEPVIHCTVQDHGYGISPGDQAQLFSKFFRSADPNIRQAAGTGLGLAITKGIIELHGGDIWFESILEEGTTFGFTIPTLS